MSLVGKDVEVLYAYSDKTLVESQSDEEDLTAEAHPPLSPASGAESLFLAGLRTSHISANALATEIHRNYRPLTSFSTVATDDYVSACSNMDDLLLQPDRRNSDLFSKDVLGLTQEPIYEETTNSIMSNKNSEEISPEVASHVYEGVKGVWGWGKQQMVISTFLGIAEGIAGKVVGVVGTDLEEIDGNIKPQLSKVDRDLLNPAIMAIVGILMKVAGKSESILKPIIVSVLKPVGLIKDEKESLVPELTGSRMAAAVN